MIKYFYIRDTNTLNNPPKHVVIDGQLHEARRVTRGAPVACIAYQRRRDEDMVEGWDLVTYALSAANGEKDEFHKRDGRIMAHDRLTGKSPENKPMDKGYCFNTETKNSANEVLYDILEEVTANSNIPSRVRRAARRWLNGENA